MCYTAIRRLACRMIVLYGYWPQLYGTVQCYTAGGRTIISSALRITMSHEIKESDWKLLRQLHPVALERFCRRILEELERINSDSAKSFHQRYLDRKSTR